MPGKPGVGVIDLAGQTYGRLTVMSLWSIEGEARWR